MVRFRTEVWLLLLQTFFRCSETFPFFSYNGSLSSTRASPSFAFLAKDVKLPKIFVLCCSIKQARFDDVGFYSVLGEDSQGWLQVRFQTLSKVTKLTLTWNGQYHILEKLHNPKLDYWYHICANIDVKWAKIEVAVNGKFMGQAIEKNITNIPTTLRMQIGADYGQQFQGSVANIKVFTDGLIEHISESPCETSEVTLLHWNPKYWNIVGSDWSQREEFEDIICNISDNYTLAISPTMMLNDGMSMCKDKLNNSIIPFENDHKWFLNYIDWHVNITGGACSYIWTPFSDQNSEGFFHNMNSNTEPPVLFWGQDEPNGGKDENFVVISVSDAVLYDVPQNWFCCSSCLISNSLLLRLDGRCKDSMIGKVKFTDNTQKYDSDEGFKILNDQSSVGFNGWKNMYIRYILMELLGKPSCKKSAVFF